MGITNSLTYFKEIIRDTISGLIGTIDIEQKKIHEEKHFFADKYITLATGATGTFSFYEE